MLTLTHAAQRPPLTLFRPGARAILGAALLGLLAAASPGQEAPAPPAPAPAPDEAPAPLPRPEAAAVDPAVAADLFAMPAVAEATRIALGLFQSGDLPGAAAVLDGLIARHPGLGLLHANRAALAMLAGEPDAALAGLEAAAERGVHEFAALLADPIFAPLGRDPARAPRVAALAASAPPSLPPPVPAPAPNGVAEVSAANTRWNPESERLEPRFALPERPVSATVLPPARPEEAARDLLADHYAAGRAAGNHGDLYDNRDRGHSALAPEAFPQLTHIAYAPAARAADVDYGLNDRLLFDRITFGNSSTALTGGALWRSLPRFALTRPDGTGPMRLWQNWAANHLYVYPAHQDYGHAAGDLFPANTPYLIVSRGSSGSDRPFLKAVAMILAAFRPDTKARLAEEGLVVPTVQFVFRRSLQNVRSREAYFSGDAHPAAFEAYHVNLARMVSLANAIAADAIPAEVRIAVVEEELGREGVDYFGEGLTEQLFDTPSAVARIWRSTTGRRSMIVSAEGSRDANGRPLAFHWRLLQGDPGKVAIEPLDGGVRARITLDWHDPFRISEANDQLTARVDIGVFAHNGAHDSAPAILSWYFPPNETRTYEAGPDGAPRIAAVDYADPAKAEVYADPLLLPRIGWRDVHAYDVAGRPAGWTRHWPEGGPPPAAYAASGARVLTADAEGRPDRTEPVTYSLARRPDGTLVVEERSASPIPAARGD